MAKPNYQYEKRQKDIAKKAKQEEKRLRKLNKGAAEGESGAEPSALVDVVEDEAQPPH
ncbi:hypothetical protein [Methylogaea oryzae]|uniref:hypothetical protein n=1 Tax=Methylogaea oryzae TaxID=1295382 RepID=UPI000AF7E1FE|nr:hypothetical protein [Methylogaea oryzae]